MTDHVCAWAAASPARYRASSSSKAASMSSRSNVTRAAIRSSASISMMLKDLDVERLGPLVAARDADTKEGEALAAGRDDGRRHIRDPDVGDRPQVRDHGIPAVSEPGIHHPTAIVVRRCRRPTSPPSRPSRGPRSTPGSARPLGLPRSPAAALGRLSSSNLASAASRSASSKSSQRLIRSPSTVRRSITRHSASKPSCEVPCAAWVTTAPKSLSRCTASMWIADVRREVPGGADVCDQIAGRERCAPPVVDVDPVRRRRGSSRRLSAA